MKKILMAMAVVMAIAVQGAPTARPAAAPVVDHVKTGVREISAGAKDANHVLVVNVGGAIDEAIFREAATYSISKLAINVWTNSVTSFDAAALVGDPGLMGRTFGEKAKVGVFLVKADNAPRFLCVPGAWCRVNVGGLDSDSPDTQTMKDRVAKMVLKGLAYAAGAGTSLDARCSMFFGGSTLEGLDKVGIRLSPGVYFPMLETLGRAGGHEIVTRQE